MAEISVYPDILELSRRAAAIFVDSALQAVEQRGRFCVCLSGGSTPRPIYSALAEEPFLGRAPWTSVHVFWGDERCAPPDHPDNNYGMARDSLLSKVPIPEDHIHRFMGEAQNAQDAAEKYEQALAGFFHLAAGDLPRFDLIFLGMGEDGHTASLFPDTAGVEETRRMAIANYSHAVRAQRLTLTMPVINNAARVVFLVTGAGKAQTLKTVLQDTKKGPLLPAGMVHPERGELIWLVDKEAAALL